MKYKNVFNIKKYIILIVSIIRFDRTELKNELNILNLGDKDVEFCSVDRFGSIEPNKRNRNDSIEFDPICV